MAAVHNNINPTSQVTIPDNVKRAWSVANLVQQAVVSLFTAFYAVYSFVEFFHPFTQETAGTIQGLRVVSLLTLPFVVVKIISNIRSVFFGNKEQEMWMPLLNISGELGLLATTLSSTLSGVSQILTLSIKVATVAQWLGFFGILLQSTGIIQETLSIIKSVQVLQVLPKKVFDSSVNAVKEDIAMLTIVAILNKDEKSLLSNRNKAIDLKEYFIKRISYAIGGRILRIIQLLFTMAATALFLLPVPVVIPLGIGVGVVVYALIFQPTEIAVKAGFELELRHLCSA